MSIDCILVEESSYGTVDLLVRYICRINFLTITFSLAYPTRYKWPSTSSPETLSTPRWLPQFPPPPVDSLIDICPEVWTSNWLLMPGEPFYLRSQTNTWLAIESEVGCPQWSFKGRTPTSSSSSSTLGMAIDFSWQQPVCFLRGGGGSIFLTRCCVHNCPISLLTPLTRFFAFWIPLVTLSLE